MENPLRAARSILERHKTRHSASGFRFALSESVNFLNASAWDGVTSSASVLMSRRYLSVLEQHRPESISPRYAMVYQGDEAVACVAAQSVQVSGQCVRKRETAPSKHGERTRKRDRLTALATNTIAGIEQRLLVCGNLLSWGCHGIAVRPGFDPALAYPGVAEALYRIRRADKLLGDTDLVVVKDFTPEQSEAAATLRTYSYRRLETEPNMMLEVPTAWRNFDDYLTALTSKYRAEARRVRKEVEQAGLQIDRGPISPDHAESLHALYMQVHSNARVRLFTLSPAFLVALSQAFGQDFRCTRVLDGNTIVGFVTTLKDGETAIGYYIGFDRSINQQVPLYFRLLQATVEDAIQMRCLRLSLGRTALEPKARLGATPVPMEVWIRHRVPAMNLIVRAAIKGVHHDEAPERTVMKAEPRAS